MKTMPDKTWVGTLLGLVLPPIGFYLFCTVHFPDESVRAVLHRYQFGNVVTHVISLSVLFINLPLFFLFIKMNRDATSRGILGATIIYAIVVLILKFI